MWLLSRGETGRHKIHDSMEEKETCLENSAKSWRGFPVKLNKLLLNSNLLLIKLQTEKYFQ